jgi:hypothetical protein
LETDAKYEKTAVICLHKNFHRLKAVASHFQVNVLLPTLPGIEPDNSIVNTVVFKSHGATNISHILPMPVPEITVAFTR